MLVHHPEGILLNLWTQLDNQDVYYSTKLNFYYLIVNIHSLFLAKTFAQLVVKLHGLREAQVILVLLQWSLRGSLG